MESGKPMTTFDTSLEIPATSEQVFAAISDPERLARWWGPAGFTNTFNVCEFKDGGYWSFVMHGPDGRDYPSENIFMEIEPDKKVIVQHMSKPKYQLTISLTASSTSAKRTLVTWSQVFENEKVANSIKHIVIPANKQNLERLSAEVLRK
jgi:uncharacterized protein YndB with AHSA1/START domain